MVGASLLWVGWFGFNGGSAVAADQNAAMAMIATHLSAATASLVWLVIEKVRFGKPSLVGFVTGTIAGLATITPASGSVGPLGGVLLGLAGGIVCYYAVELIKLRMRIDDSLDVLAVHGVGGATGTLLVPFVASIGYGGTGLAAGVTMGNQFLTQLIGVAVVAFWSAVATIVIVLITKAVIGLRVTDLEEIEGLDYSSHGETGLSPVNSLTIKISQGAAHQLPFLLCKTKIFCPQRFWVVILCYTPWEKHGIRT